MRTEASPEEFFVPYVWSLAVAHGGVPWTLPAITLFTPTGAPRPGQGGAGRSGGGGGGADQAGGIHLPLQAVAAPVLHASPAFNPYVPLLLPRCDVQSCPSHRRCRSRPARRCERMPRQQLRWCTFDTLDVFVTVPPTLQCPPTLAAWLQTTLGDAASLAARLASSLSVGAGAAGPHPDSGAASNAV